MVLCFALPVVMSELKAVRSIPQSSGAGTLSHPDSPSKAVTSVPRSQCKDLPGSSRSNERTTDVPTARLLGHVRLRAVLGLPRRDGHELLRLCRCAPPAARSASFEPTKRDSASSVSSVLRDWHGTGTSTWPPWRLRGKPKQPPLCRWPSSGRWSCLSQPSRRLPFGKG